MFDAEQGSQSSKKIYIILDNNIFDLFDEPIANLFSDFELIYPGEVFQEGQNIPNVPEKIMTKENRTIVEGMLKPTGYVNSFPLSFPIQFYPQDVHTMAAKYIDDLGNTDAYLIGITKHFPGTALLLTNDGLSPNGKKKGLIKKAESEGLTVVSGHSKAQLLENLDFAVKKLKGLTHA